MSTRPGGAYAKGTPSLSTQRHGASSGERSAPLEPEALVGRLLDGRFRLERVLNAGGMGIVYVATQLSVGRKVAVKVLRPTLACEPDLRKRFLREVRLIAALDHPHIVSLVDAGTDASGLSYLVMELVEGQTLRQLLVAHELTLTEIVAAFCQVCEALIEAHGHGVIHRDLKFDNVMISRLRDGRLYARVLDFGVAKAIDGRDNEALTRGGQVPGTPGIVAPELVDEQQPTARSDLYSLGVLLYTALAGRTPFEGRNDLELMHAHKYLDLPDLRPLLGSKVPGALIELAYELLEKDPLRRPDNAAEARDRLERVAAELRRLPDQQPYRAATTDPAALHVGGPTAEEPLPPIPGRHGASTSPYAIDAPDRDKAPIIAPASVVAVLVALLLVLILILIYVVYQVLLPPTAPPPQPPAQEQALQQQEEVTPPEFRSP